MDKNEQMSVFQAVLSPFSVEAGLVLLDRAVRILRRQGWHDGLIFDAIEEVEHERFYSQGQGKAKSTLRNWKGRAG
jgi:hypothetical protein